MMKRSVPFAWSRLPARLCCALLTLVALLAGAESARAVTVDSPAGHLRIAVAVDRQGHLSWSVKRQGRIALSPAPLGLTVDGQDLGQGVALGTPRTRTFREEYPIFGNHTTAVSHYNEAVIPVTRREGGVHYEVAVRAFDDGAAVRFTVPLQGEHEIQRETTAWGLPAGARAWWAKYGYEAVNASGAFGEIPEKTTLAPPVTLSLGDNLYLAITEADNAAFPDMGLARQGKRLTAVFPACAKGWKQSGPIVTPWRVAIVAEGLNALVNSDLLTNLCPPPPAELANADWIRPGRSLWQWWSIGAPLLEDQRQWVDAAKKLGFEYYLIDDGWRDWRAPGKDQWQCLKEVIDYSKAQGVGALVWVDSKEMRTDEGRRTYLGKVRDLGAVGIKIDFIPPATPEIAKWYEGALADTAELKLLCNFHGAVKPTGRRRTWPHELTREAVRGHEYQITRYKRTLEPEHDVTIPFTRYLLGPADYTPTAFVPSELRGYTWAHELAQAVVMTSPLLHFTDNYKYYIGNPAEGVLRVLPSVWDETIVLPDSEIGKVVGFARRRGKDWFIGVLNGGQPTSMKLALGFLGQGSWQAELFGDAAGREDAFKRESRTLQAGDTLALELRPRGGFVAHLKAR